jgi:hypothetical protein
MAVQLRPLSKCFGPFLPLILLLLRKLYGGGCALLPGLLLVILGLSAHFGFGSLIILVGLWALGGCFLINGQNACRVRTGNNGS